MILTKSEIENIIHEETQKYFSEVFLFEYTVKSGDTLSKIAQDQEIDFQSLLNANPQLKDKDTIEIGDQINIPGISEPEENIYWGPDWIWKQAGYKDGVKYLRGLPKSLKANSEAIKQGKATEVMTCDDTGCSKWVSDTLKVSVSRRGNAWHQHGLRPLPSYTSFKFDKASADEAAKIFTKINQNPGINLNSIVKKFVRNFIPNQPSLKSQLNLGDVVGLYWANSGYFTTAFFEGATGHYQDETVGPHRAAAGPYFINSDTGNKWTRDDLGKGVTFVPGRTLLAGGGFGMNTHLGFVGAMYEGEPVIFHQVYGHVWAEPLSSIDTSRMAILWAKPGTAGWLSEGNSQRKSVRIKIIKESAPQAKGSMVPAKQHPILRSSAPNNIKTALYVVSIAKEKIMSSLDIDEATLKLLASAAVGVSGRESSFEKGKMYRYSDWAEILVSQVADFLGSGPDLSVGGTQIRYQSHFKDTPGHPLASYADAVGIKGPGDLGDFPKAIMGTIGILSFLYKKAVGVGHSTSNPGVSRNEFTSTGNAALDLALVGYNNSPQWVTSYCGSGELKKKCSDAPGEPVVRNYIPALETPGRKQMISPLTIRTRSTGQVLLSLGYISEVARGMKKYGAIAGLI
jgi:murein DD-endopeptidase MepM/ murein hydrolase activator NlpD